MFEVILFIATMTGGIGFEDTRGPYETKKQCLERKAELVELAHKFPYAIRIYSKCKRLEAA